MPKEKERRVYASVTTALPPLSMVLVTAQNERQNAASRPVLESPEATEKHKKKKIVRRLIEHLEHEE